MSDTVVRSARRDDAEALAELSTQLGYPSDAESMRQRLDAALSSPEHMIYVCCIDSELAAWIHVMRTVHLESGFGVEIAGLIVSQRRRGQGLGTQLVRDAMSWAKSQGFERLRVRSRAERVGAHAFYQGLGFEQEKLQHVFACPLP
ncbi:MAG: GNAT family N-acetyltransferase [Acidihalobacter sp.]